MIWGYHYFWKHPYLYSICVQIVCISILESTCFLRNLEHGTSNKSKMHWKSLTDTIDEPGNCLKLESYEFGYTPKKCPCVLGSKLLVLGMGDIQPWIGNPYNGYKNPYYWVDGHPLLYGNNGSLDPGTCTLKNSGWKMLEDCLSFWNGPFFIGAYRNFQGCIHLIFTTNQPEEIPTDEAKWHEKQRTTMCSAGIALAFVWVCVSFVVCSQVAKSKRNPWQIGSPIWNMVMLGRLP